MPKTIQFEGRTYHSLPAAAELLGMSRLTVYFMAKKTAEGGTFPAWDPDEGRLEELRLDVVRDPLNRRWYLSEDSVDRLNTRFEPVNYDSDVVLRRTSEAT